MRTYVIGNEDAVLGFSLVGVDGHAVTSGDELEQQLATCMADRTIGLLLITSDVARLARERIDTLKIGSLSPLVVEIPGQQSDATTPSLVDFVQRAVGISLGGR